MDVAKIVANSFKYPFRNIAKLPIICILFILISIVPLGMIFDNRYIVIIGTISFFAFILIVPGYLLSIVRNGSIGSSAMPSLSLTNNIYDSIKVIALRAVYMIVPVAAFLIVLSTLGTASIDMLFNLKIIEFLATFGLSIILILIIYIVFEFLLFFAKARLAYFGSLSEALKINRVIGDIRNIGFFTIIKWIIIMAILINVISFVASFVMSIPYVGFLIYICIVIPIIESIGNYSLGLIYSNIAKNNADYNLKKIRG